jgi:DNA helicase-2/ATP-dependent DNA helicase PcrA
MDKKVMFAVAGSGKTTYIINQLSEDQRAIIVTYSINNLNNIKNSVLKRWGYIPKQIKIYSYFEFLYSFCYRPFLSYSYRAKGINWERNKHTLSKNDARYVDPYKRLYSNRIAKFLEVKGITHDIRNRLKKYFDFIYIDEIQDFGGHDFNFLKHLVDADISTLFVGDFFQHTYDTSRDGNVNNKLHADYSEYEKRFKKMGVVIDTTTLVKSHRCSPTVCSFIADNLGIHIESTRQDLTKLKIIENITEIAQIYNDAATIKLFLDEHYRYNCYSRNWGDCKGENKYQDVCVVVNSKSWKLFKAKKLQELAPIVRNKLYVACSRANRDLYLISEDLLNNYLNPNASKAFQLDLFG